MYVFRACHSWPQENGNHPSLGPRSDRLAARPSQLRICRRWPKWGNTILDFSRPYIFPSYCYSLPLRKAVLILLLKATSRQGHLISALIYLHRLQPNQSLRMGAHVLPFPVDAQLPIAPGGPRVSIASSAMCPSTSLLGLLPWQAAKPPPKCVRESRNGTG